MPKRERYAIKFQRGGIVPADELTKAKMNDRFKIGDFGFMEIVRPRNPGYHDFAHALGKLFKDNLEPFEHLHQHDVLKRLQIEAQAGCEFMGIYVPGVGLCQHIIPKSLSWESMDQTEFEDTVSRICDHVAKTYWPSLTADQVQEMAEAMA